MRLLLALAALLSPASVYAPNAKELTTSTLNVLLKRTDLLVVQYHQTHASDAALGAVAERLGRAGHTAGTMAAVGRINVESYPDAADMARAAGVGAFPALAVYEDGELATTVCEGQLCAALDEDAMLAAVLERLNARNREIGTNTTLPELWECEEAVAQAQAVLLEDENKKPMPANGTRGLCSDFTDCASCRKADCGWCRIDQVCVVDEPNHCTGIKDHIGVNGFDVSCDANVCEDASCCVQIDQKCGLIEKNFGAKVWRENCETPLSDLVDGAPSQIIGLLCPCSCGFCPSRACATDDGETEEDKLLRARAYNRGVSRDDEAEQLALDRPSPTKPVFVCLWMWDCSTKADVLLVFSEQARSWLRCRARCGSCCRRCSTDTPWQGAPRRKSGTRAPSITCVRSPPSPRLCIWPGLGTFIWLEISSIGARFGQGRRRS